MRNSKRNENPDKKELLYLCSVDVDHIEVHGNQRAKEEQKNSEAEPGGRVAAALARAAAPALEIGDATVSSYMVVQMLRSIKKTAASSCKMPRLILRPKIVRRPMLSGMTRRGSGNSQTGALSIHMMRPHPL